MNDKPTTTDLLNDEQLLRAEIGKVLAEKPWKHEPEHGAYNCKKCGTRYWTSSLRRTKESASPCLVPDPWTGPLEVAAERLVKKLSRIQLIEAIWRFRPTNFHAKEDAIEAYEWFILEARPAVRCAVCLEVLKTKGDMK